MTNLQYLSIRSAVRIADQINAHGVKSIAVDLQRASLIWLMDCQQMGAKDVRIDAAVSKLVRSGVSTVTRDYRRKNHFEWMENPRPASGQRTEG
jgi:hypothetical protein